MPTRRNELAEHLSRSSEINITVTGRKSGRPITIPVWFVAEPDTLYLLPVQGSSTQWYRNVLENPSIRIEARAARADLKTVPLTDRKQVTPIVEKFRAKYGAADVKKYYSGFDVAVRVPMQ